MVKFKNPFKFKRRKKTKRIKEKEKKLRPKSLKSKSLKSKMTIFNIFIIFLISIIMATLSYGFLKKSIYASSDELLLNKATDAANLVDERIKRYILNIESVAKYQKKLRTQMRI